MGRIVNSASFIQPLDSSGDPVDLAANHHGRGVYRLTAGTYYFPLGGADAILQHAHLWGDNTIVITSATIEECSFPESEVDDYDDTSGFWLATDAARISSVVEGTGWTNTSDVIAVSGGTAGGGAWTVSDNAARRLRVKMVVGTAGHMRMSAWGKD